MALEIGAKGWIVLYINAPSPDAVVSLPTSLTIFSSVDPSAAGTQAVTFTAAVAPNNSSLIVPTGTVTFTVDGTAQSPSSLNSEGLATLSGQVFSAGSHSIGASYSGDATFSPSVAPTFTQTAS